MIALLSPSKTQDFSDYQVFAHITTPVFLNEAETLVNQLTKFDKSELKELLDVSDDLAELNYERFQDFDIPFDESNAKPALLAYKGDVYEPIHTETYDQDDFAFAQDHVRIFSGLYGLLRPLDLIQPYRLEMNTKLENLEGKDLYKFWSEKITEHLNDELAKHEDDIIVNLASNQYFKVLDKKNLEGEVITPKFKERKGTDYQTIAIYAKKARGMMTEYLVRHQLEDVNKLKAFDDVGYYYNEDLSDGNEWVFTRDL
jgi:cytoplasmic iron level regulating protein YaaA (DUF328/UPF0246 family)